MGKVLINIFLFVDYLVGGYDAYIGIDFSKSQFYSDILVISYGLSFAMNISGY